MAHVDPSGALPPLLMTPTARAFEMPATAPYEPGTVTVGVGSTMLVEPMDGSNGTPVGCQAPLGPGAGFGAEGVSLKQLMNDSPRPACRAMTSDDALAASETATDVPCAPVAVTEPKLTPVIVNVMSLAIGVPPGPPVAL